MGTKLTTMIRKRDCAKRAADRANYAVSMIAASRSTATERRAAQAARIAVLAAEAEQQLADACEMLAE